MGSLFFVILHFFAFGQHYSRSRVLEYRFFPLGLLQADVNDRARIF